MRQLRYTNTVLTILAALLTMQLWTSWTAWGPELVPQARAAGIPDEGAQREQMISLLKLLVQKTEEIKSLMESGKLTVNVAGGPGEGDKK
jgi:hypothetical protein